jgi:hypothetical protein
MLQCMEDTACATSPNTARVGQVSAEFGSVGEQGRPPPKDRVGSATVRLCHGCGRQGHLIRNCLETKRKIILDAHQQKLMLYSQSVLQASQDF